MTISDRRGNFRVEGLPDGRYSAEATAPGYVLAGPGNLEPTLYPVGSSINLTLTKGGVITGRVTNSTGEPLVAISVKAVRVRSLDENRRVAAFSRESQTDDRGMYRIFGLPPGVYVVAAGGKSLLYTVANYFKFDAPSFYPAGARETASDIRIDVGTEVGDVDIKHGGERGHVVSGRITQGLPDKAVSVFLTLSRVGAGGTEFFESVLLDNRNNGFSISGIPSGSYNLVARVRSPSVEGFAIRRLEVKDRDLSGVVMSLIKLSAIAGQLRFESTGNRCTEAAIKPETFVVTVERTTVGEEDFADAFSSINSHGSVNREGSFTVGGLIKGRYRIGMHLPGEEWYIKKISLPATDSISRIKPRDIGQDGLLVQPGETVQPLLISVDSGAAMLQGRISAPNGKPRSVRVTIVPAETDQAANVLRYVERTVEGERFEVPNLAPGRYHIMAELIDAEIKNSVSVLKERWDSSVRDEVRRRAQQTGKVLEVGRCQRLEDYEVPLTVTAQP